MSSLWEDLSWRGLVHQATDPGALAKLLDGDVLCAYIGFDPTADSLGVGHLQQLLLLRRLQEAGHRPIALVGGGTGMIGDPSFKSEERVLLDAEALRANSAGVRRQLESFMSPGPSAAVITDNSEWLSEARLIEFLRDVGKHFSVNEMIRKDSVRSRLVGREQGISFTEMSYMLLQAWDFVQLFDRYGCRLQLGGSDQWGNIVEGVELLRRKREIQAFGLTSPLLTKADGTKFGKTESGNVWLDPARTSPYEFYQFWYSTADSDVGPFLRRLTLLGRDDIEELECSTAEHPERREGQRALAHELTTLVHGPGQCRGAEAAAAALFTEDVAGLESETLRAALSDAPTTAVADLAQVPLSLVDALVLSGLAASKAAARRDIAGGGVSINGRRQGQDRLLEPGDALHGRYVLLRRGRRTQHVLVVS